MYDALNKAADQINENFKILNVKIHELTKRLDYFEKSYHDAIKTNFIHVFPPPNDLGTGEAKIDKLKRRVEALERDGFKISYFQIVSALSDALAAFELKLEREANE